MKRYIVPANDELGDFEIKVSFPDKENKKEKFSIYIKGEEINHEANQKDLMDRIIRAKPEFDVLVELHGRSYDGSVPSIIQEGWEVAGHGGVGSPERLASLFGIDMEKAKEVVSLVEIDCFSREKLKNIWKEQAPKWEEKANLAYEIEESFNNPPPSMKM